LDEDALIDRHGRKIDSLRISLTERCNFRCLYCMPPEGVALQSSSKYLTPAEIERFSRIAVQQGVTKIRLTGGEPLLRPESIEIVERLAAISGLKDLALTTNGSRLKKMALPLKHAGLKRINVSLDSLDPIGFKKISYSDSYSDVMEGVLAALSEKFPVKLNMVVMKGINDHEVPEFIEFALNNPFEEVRFIEFMPLCGTGWKPKLVYAFDELLEKVAASYYIEKIHIFNTLYLDILSSVCPLLNYKNQISIEATEDTVMLVLSGQPIDEPIAAYGPFLMNTWQEVEQAIQDVNAGKFGVLED